MPVPDDQGDEPTRFDFRTFDAQRLRAERRVDDELRVQVQRRDGPAVWANILSRPIAEAVNAAAHLADLRWRPDDSLGRALADRLVAENHHAVAAVADRATKLATRSMPMVLDPVGQVSAELTVGEPQVVIAALELAAGSMSAWGSEESHGCLIRLDVAGRPTEIDTVGAQCHSSLGCLRDGSVVAVRDASLVTVEGTTFRWELMRYGPQGAVLITDGDGAPFPRVVTTPHGYVVGLTMSSDVIVGGIDTPPYLLDLSPAGIRYHTNHLAVDPTGIRIAFGDAQSILVTDTHLQELVITADIPSSVHGRLDDLILVSPDVLITSGGHALCRWMIEHGQLRPEVVAATQSVVRDMFAVPAWGVVAGLINGPNLAFFDIDTLDPLPEPPAVRGTRSLNRRMYATPGGRFVVYNGYLRSESQGEPRLESIVFVHDLAHPLSWLHRPLAKLKRADLADLTALLEGGAPRPHVSAHVLAGDERRILDLVRSAAEYRVAVAETA